MKIVIAEPLGLTPQTFSPILQEWSSLGHELEIFFDRNENPEILTQRIKDADIVLISNIPLNESILSNCPNLKFISVAFTGLDHIDLNYCNSNHIVVKNCAGYATTAVAELTIGLILDLYRHISFLDQKTRIGGTRNNFLGKQIKDKIVGIIGTGAIGTETALLAQQFGAKVIAWSRTSRSELTKMGIRYVSLEELMTISDIISIHTPLNIETENLIHEALLNLCKPTAVIINTARGKVVDMECLARFLNEGKLGGAAFDVFEKEPPLPENHPLLHTPNCVVVPHIAYATEESFAKRIELVFQNVKNFLNL
jgi:phosphoglycerate dehydrogenase-like enzyme